MKKPVNSDFDIDFIITWVDGSDEEWIKEKNRYSEKKLTDGNAASENRYRDWDLLRYWFRGVEKNAPWVHKIYFVTCGQKPEWLREDHPKLVLMNHKDFMPKEYLPTFNSSTIMMNLHRIPGLSERFVNFNDDHFLISPVAKEDFFVGEQVVDHAILSVISPELVTDMFPHCLVNNLSLINTYFNKKEVLKKYPKTFYSPKYGKGLLKNLYLTPAAYFTGFKDDHLPAPYFKKYYEAVWEKESERLDKASHNRFRSPEDFTEWVVKNWQFCSGATLPRDRKWGQCYQLGMDEGYLEAIRRQAYKAICINDSYADRFDFEEVKAALKEAFESIMPEPCTFELEGL